jgi:hypothetical protein
MAVAHEVIRQLPAQQAPAVRAAVNHAFLDGLRISTLVCAGIAVSAAVVVARLLPGRPGLETDVTEFNWDQLEREIR